MGTHPIFESDFDCLTEPSHMMIINESRNHGFRHGQESHFNITIVSSAFEDERSVARQRKIYRTLRDELKQIHALSVSARTPAEHSKDPPPHHTPPCAGKS